MAAVLNSLSLNEPLPVVFKTVSPPPYMNGGPEDFLSWVVETIAPDFLPDKCVTWLEGSLPQPADEPEAWNEDP